MASRARAFAANADLVATAQPYMVPASPLKTGFYLGRSTGTLQIQWLDFQALKAAGIISNTNIGIAGLIESGKTTLAKCIADGTLSLKAGVEQGEPRRSRVRVNDRKLEEYSDGGKTITRGEYATLADHYAYPVIELEHHGGINIFDPRMGTDESDLVRMTVGVFEDVKRTPLTTTEVLAAQVTVAKMTRELRGTPPNIEIFAAMSSRITIDDAKHLDANRQQVLFDRYAEDIAKSPELGDELRRIFAAPNHLITDPALGEELRRAGTHLNSYANELIHSGRYGNMFGGIQSPYELLTNQLTVLDWNGLTKDASDLLEGLMYQWINVGLRNGDTTVTPDVMISDEEGSELSGLMHARQRAELSRKKRANRTVDISLYQYITDAVSVGESGSALRHYGEVIHRGISMWFIGRQHSDDATMEVLTGNLKISEENAYTITQLAQGYFAVVIPDQPVFFLRHDVLPSQKEIIKSNRANENAMAGRTANTERTEILERMRQLGRITTETDTTIRLEKDRESA